MRPDSLIDLEFLGGTKGGKNDQMIKRKPQIFYTGVLFLCVLFASCTEINGSARYQNDTDVTAYLTAKRVEADP